MADNPEPTVHTPARTAKPLVRWAGGKRWLIPALAEYAPLEFARYIEPFLGGGAVFFHFKPDQSILGDLNAELIRAYHAIASSPLEVHERLASLLEKHSKTFYYVIRESEPSSDIDAAARFLYLNWTCWNGLYRVNLRGKFNVPVGSRCSVLASRDDFLAASEAFRNAELRCADFETLVDCAGAGDFIFVDPPYTVHHNLNGFLKYNEKIFSWNDQRRLYFSLERARQRGAYVVVTNACHTSVASLYGEEYKISVESRFSSISSKAASRENYKEYVLVGGPKL